MAIIHCLELMIKYIAVLILIPNILLISGQADDEMWEGESEGQWIEENPNINEKKKNDSEEAPRIYPEQAGSKDTIDEDKMPKMHPEDATSFYMPEYHWCDGCRVVSYQIIKTLDLAHKKRPSIKRLSEVDLIDILEGLCEEGFEDYGMMEYNGQSRLAGPGLETNEAEGYRLSGGKWPHRLRMMCGEYIGEIGEMVLYREYLKDKDMFTSFLCQGPGIRNKCGEIDWSKYGRKDEL